jgi:hypothetical protein
MGGLMFLSTSIVVRLAHQHETIGSLIEGLSETELKQKVNQDKWSSFEQIAHLAAYQPGFLGRLDSMLSEPEPAFDRYVAENDPLFYNCLKLSLPQLSDGIGADRLSIQKKLSGLSEPDLKRTGLHPRFGKMNLVQWTEFFLLHEAHHIYSLFMLTRELRKPG